MKIELREHYGKNIATGKTIYLNQRRIFVDGRAVGFFHDKSQNVSIVESISPECLKLILERCESFEKVQQAPEVPADFTGDNETYDDFDT